MKKVNLKDVESVEMVMEGAKNTYKQVPLSKDDGSPNFSFRVFTIHPDGHTPYHTHPFEHLNYVISGQGAIVDADGKESEISTGEFALILPDEKHQYRNRSKTEPLVVICAVPKEYE